MRERTTPGAAVARGMSDRSSSGSSSTSCERATTASAPASRAARRIAGSVWRPNASTLAPAAFAARISAGASMPAACRSTTTSVRVRRDGEVRRGRAVGDARLQPERFGGRADARLEHQVDDDDGDGGAHAAIIPPSGGADRAIFARFRLLRGAPPTSRGGGTGIRSGLKIRRSQDLVGSNPTPGTSRYSRTRYAGARARQFLS